MASSSPRVEQPLQDDPPVGHVAVAGEVDPAQPAVGEAAADLVLAGDELAGRQLGHERERVAAAPAEALGAPGRRRPGCARRARRSSPQNRRCSATWGSAITAVAGSLAGTGGISTSPAPRRRRLTTVPLRDDDADDARWGPRGSRRRGPGPRCRRAGAGGRPRAGPDGLRWCRTCRCRAPARRTRCHPTVVAVAVRGSRRGIRRAGTSWRRPRSLGQRASALPGTAGPASAATARSVGAVKSSVGGLRAAAPSRPGSSTWPSRPALAV